MYVNNLKPTDMKEYEDLKKELIEIAKILKEYPEGLQSTVFGILSKTYIGDIKISDIKSLSESTKVDESQAKKTALKNPKSSSVSTSPKKKPSSLKDSYKIVKTLNLKGDNSNPSLQKFCEDKITDSSIKFNVVAAYYLKKILNIENVSPDHIYSCYKEMKIKVPTRLLQSLRDTAGPKYGYLDTSDINNIKVPVTGENLVEINLKMKPKK